MNRFQIIGYRADSHSNEYAIKIFLIFPVFLLQYEFFRFLPTFDPNQFRILQNPDILPHFQLFHAGTCCTEPIAAQSDRYLSADSGKAMSSTHRRQGISAR